MDSVIIFDKIDTRAYLLRWYFALTVTFIDKEIAMTPGSLSLVAQNILLKRGLLRLNSPKAEKIRTLLLILGGANRGAYGSGAGIALHALGLAGVFDIIVGVSTGAWIGGISRQARSRCGLARLFTTKIFPVRVLSHIATRGRS